jgi:hypothetical protein
MHRAAPAAAETRFESQNLGHGPVQEFQNLLVFDSLGPREAVRAQEGKAFGEELVVATVGTVDTIAATQCQHGADG